MKKTIFQLSIATSLVLFFTVCNNQDKKECSKTISTTQTAQVSLSNQVTLAKSLPADSIYVIDKVKIVPSFNLKDSISKQLFILSCYSNKLNNCKRDTLSFQEVEKLSQGNKILSDPTIRKLCNCGPAWKINNKKFEVNEANIKCMSGGSISEYQTILDDSRILQSQYYYIH